MNPTLTPPRTEGDQAYQPVTIEQEAAQILEAAHKQAADILEQAREAARDARRHQQQAHDDARPEQTELRQLSSALAALVNDLKQEWKGFTRTAEVELLRLAFAIAELLVGKEIDSSDDVLRTAMSRAVKLAMPEARWQVLVNPADLDAARRLLPGLEGRLQAEGWLVLSPSQGVRRGGCLLKSRHVEIDATVETQLAQIKRTLLADLSHQIRTAEQHEASRNGKELTADVYTSS